MDIPCLSPKCLEDTQVFAWGMCAANTPLWELSMLHYGAKSSKEAEKKETFPDFFATVIRLFLAPFFTRRPALISRPYIMFLVEQQQCMGELNFWLLLAGFFYRCTTRRYCFLRSTRDSMFVTLIAFLLRAHVNSLLSTQSWLIIILRNANIFGKYSLE